jgi:hypothetical protein
MLQESFDFGEPERLLAPLQAQWQDALEKAKANRTVFAQRRIRPDEVLPEWHKQQQALGSKPTCSAFCKAPAYAWAHHWTTHAAPTRCASPSAPARGPAPAPGRRRAGAAQLIDFDELHRSHPSWACWPNTCWKTRWETPARGSRQRGHADQRR